MQTLVSGKVSASMKPLEAQIITAQPVFYMVQSFTNRSRFYKVKEQSGKWSCDCPAWKFTKGHSKDCKHILQVKAEKKQGLA